MRVGLLTAGFLLTSAIVSNAAIVNISPPPSPPPTKSQAPLPPVPLLPHAPTPGPATAKAPAPTSAPLAAKVLAKAKVTCPCDCPKDQAVRQHAQARLAPRRMAHGAFRRYADRGYYSYGAAAPVVRHDWHGQWRVVPNDTAIVPHYGYSQEGVPVDDRGWTGGVGTAADGSGGFVDGYGQVHFANGGENGPSYNSYGQSFQFNPSQAGPFQPRLMGGFAPSNK